GADHHESLALEADSLHYATDIWINGTVFALVLVDYMNIAPLWLDPLCALLVAGLMVRAAWYIALKAFAMLMDQELSADIKSRMIAVIRSHPEVMGVHDLRATQSGMRKRVSFDIEVDPNLLLWSAHEISRSVENALLAEFPLAEIMIHIDPYGDTEDSRHDHPRR
ncbi:MAG: cation diffusion facilitator family transporter, partial [Pseudomonadota bacterium]